jgi:SAM-dependent methyltransferase
MYDINRVAPLLNVFINNMDLLKRTYQIYCLDDFNSKINKDSDEWFNINMNIEGYASKINLITSGFKSLPIIDNAIDVIVMPTGNFSNYLYQANNKDEVEKKLIYQSFVNEMHRILRPGGRFISTRGVILSDEWNEAFDNSSFERYTDSTQDYFFVSFIPSQIDIYRKGYGKFIPPSLDNNLNTTTNPLVSINEPKRNSFTNLHISSSSNLYNDCYSIFQFGIHQSIKQLEIIDQVRTPFENELHTVESETISRTKKLANVLVLSIFSSWIFVVLVVWINLNYLDFPANLGYDLMLSANCVQNLSTIPILMFYEYDKIMNAAVIYSDAIKNSETGRNDSVISAYEYQGIKNAIEEKLAVKRVWRAYFNAWFEIGIYQVNLKFNNYYLLF